MVEQIAVFIENKKGRILELTGVLAKNGIDLLTLSIADTKDFGILRCVTRDNSKAVTVLRDAGFTVSVNHIVGVLVDDVPGGLESVLKALDKENVNIEYLYSFAHTASGNAIILIQIEDKDLAVRILHENNIKLISDINI